MPPERVPPGPTVDPSSGAITFRVDEDTAGGRSGCGSTCAASAQDPQVPAGAPAVGGALPRGRRWPGSSTCWTSSRPRRAPAGVRSGQPAAARRESSATSPSWSCPATRSRVADGRRGVRRVARTSSAAPPWQVVALGALASRPDARPSPGPMGALHSAGPRGAAPHVRQGSTGSGTRRRTSPRSAHCSRPGDSTPGSALPLLLVHDGPEYDAVRRAVAVPGVLGAARARPALPGRPAAADRPRTVATRPRPDTRGALAEGMLPKVRDSVAVPRTRGRDGCGPGRLRYGPHRRFPGQGRPCRGMANPAPLHFRRRWDGARYRFSTGSRTLSPGSMATRRA